MRWALDCKRIPHVRRSLLPGPHRLKTRRLTGGEVATTPVLTVDGRSIGDSTRIVAAIERRWPDPPLYPREEAQRRRALELEEYFDEELAPHLRRALYHAMLSHPGLTAPLFTQGRRLPARMLLRGSFPLLRRAISRTFEIDDATAEESRRRTVAAMDRLEAEIGPSAPRPEASARAAARPPVDFRHGPRCAGRAPPSPADRGRQGAGRPAGPGRRAA